MPRHAALGGYFSSYDSREMRKKWPVLESVHVITTGSLLQVSEATERVSPHWSVDSPLPRVVSVWQVSAGGLPWFTQPVGITLDGPGGGSWLYNY